ncbi:MAG: tetratricopeptide repeat protein [Acidobacteriota bacterium]
MDKKQFNAKLKHAATVEERIALYDTYGEELFKKEKYAEAIDVYSMAMNIRNRPNVRAYFAGQIGICHYNAGNDTDAIKFLQQSTRLFKPDKPEFMEDMFGFVYFHLGSLYEYHGKISQALKARAVCEKYIEFQEKDTQWMLFAGISRNYESLGKNDEAIRYSQKAIQVISDNDPGLSYLYESMANNYMGLNQYQEAIKYFSKVLELDPNFERKDDIQLKMGGCYHLLANYKMALETYEKIFELNQITGMKKDQTWLYLKITECYFRLEMFEKSLLVTLEMLRRNPKKKEDRAEAHSFLTNNYYELGRYKEAVEEGEKTLKIATRFLNDDLFYARMALSYHKLGDKKSFRKYRTLFKKHFKEENWNKYLDKLQ